MSVLGNFLGTNTKKESMTTYTLTQGQRDELMAAIADDGSENSDLLVMLQHLRVAAPSASPWQPIETAPKDGTTVLLHPPSWANRTSSTGSWNSDKYARKPAPYWERDDCWNKVMLSRNSPTTHWMPLPARDS